jgi:phage-related protein
MAAQKVALLAGAAATGIATAAQWAWNAAMSANPIGLIILAIVALVAGLVWFFTQTELGRQIFQSVFSFIQDTVNNVIRWFTGTLVPLFQSVWSNIQNGLGRVGAFFSDTWSNVVSGVSGFIRNIVQFFLDLPGKITSALGNMGTFLLDSGRALIQGFIDGIKGMVGAIGDAVGGVLDFAKSFFPHSPAKRGPFSGSGYTSFSGKALAEDFAGGIDSQQALVARSASRLMSSASLEMNAGQVAASGTAGGSNGPAKTIINNFNELSSPRATALQVARIQDGL